MIDHWIIPWKQNEERVHSHLDMERFYGKSDLNLNSYRLAFISAPGSRSEKILDSLHYFQNHFGDIKMIDLGVLRKSEATFNIQLIKELNEGEITVIVLDQDFRWFSAIMSSYGKHENTTQACISNKLIFSEYGLTCDFIAFQRHLVSLDHLNRIGDHSINSMSLGKLRAETHLAEPILRDYSGIHFDVSAIRRCDVPGSHSSMPTGLSAEEACQVMKYIGGSTRLKLMVIGGDFQPDEITCDTIAQSIWYLMEGVNQSKSDHPTVDKNYQQFIVDNENLKESFHFIKNNSTGRWWFNAGSENENDEFVACSHQEYLDTIHQELPDRLFKYLAKIY